MQFNPGRSWAVTYTHMWNLSMRTPLPSRNTFPTSSSGGNHFLQELILQLQLELVVVMVVMVKEQSQTTAGVLTRDRSVSLARNVIC